MDLITTTVTRYFHYPKPSPVHTRLVFEMLSLFLPSSSSLMLGSASSFHSFFTTRRDSLAIPHASVISLCRHHSALFVWGDSRPIFVVVPSVHIRVRYFSNPSESDLSVPTVVVLFIKDSVQQWVSDAPD